MHAGAKDRAEAWLESDNAVERGGPDDRTEGLAAERQRDQPCGDGRRRAGRRSARRMLAVPGVDRRSRVPPGEFGRYRLAEYRRAEIAQPLDDPRVRGGNVTSVDR